VQLLRDRTPSQHRNNESFTDPESPHYRTLHGHTLAEHVAFLQRKFDRVVLDMFNDTAWKAKLVGFDMTSLMAAMVAVHAEYVASVLLEAWARENRKTLDEFGTRVVISPAGYNAVRAEAVERSHTIETFLLAMRSPNPDNDRDDRDVDIDVDGAVVPNRAGESWDDGLMSKKQRMCADRVQGIGDNPHWCAINAINLVATTTLAAVDRLATSTPVGAAHARPWPRMWHTHTPTAERGSPFL
jgi:hypothetical protein